MIKFGKWVVKHRVIILIICLALLVPSFLGMVNTRVNYDILSYLPKDIETMKGQDVLMEDFGKGGFSLVMIDGMTDKQVADTKAKIQKVDHVADVVWYDTIADITLPKEVLPDNLYDFFNKGDSTLMAVFFDDTTSADGTMAAIKEIRNVAGKQCFVSGQSAVITDTKDLSEQETTMYVVIAVILTSIVLAVAMDSFLVPVFFMISIGMAILYNLGTNLFLGDVSFITKALAAVLQLGVTMDYSIFLWHSYKEKQKIYPGDKERAMAHAISNTFVSVVGSSTTTVAGFLAMCFMSFTLGLNLGIVMAKGVIFGVLCCVTVLPSMILIFDKAIEKTSHKDIIPRTLKLSKFIVKHFVVFAIAFVVILIPAYYGSTHYDIYYNLDSTLPKDLDSIIANSKLSEEFDMNCTHMLLTDADMSPKDVIAMTDKMKAVDGVSYVLNLDSLIGPTIPQEVIPDEVTSILKSNGWQLMLVGSEYPVASDELNDQISSLNKIAHEYDSNSMLIGEGPATKDLIDITDHDFAVVNAVSIIVIFIIIAFVMKSFSLPFVLVAVIEFAIFINMGIPCYTNTSLPFVASIVIGTIQLGATVDYAILMTTRYKKERINGKSKKESVEIALNTSIVSVVTSALGFFAATFGVGAYSRIDMISAICTLLSRGAIISMLTVIFILPSMFMIFDKLICKTTFGMRHLNKDNVKKEEKLANV